MLKCQRNTLSDCIDAASASEPIHYEQTVTLS